MDDILGVLIIVGAIGISIFSISSCESKKLCLEKTNSVECMK